MSCRRPAVAWLAPLVAGACLLTAPMAVAEVLVTYVSKDRPYFTIAVPDGWRIRTGFEVDPATMPDGRAPMPRVVSAMPEDDEILWLGFWVPDGVSDLDQAQAYLTSLEGFLLDEPRVTRTTENEINGLAARLIRGTGLSEGERADFTVGLFQIAADTVAVAIYIGRPGARETHRDELRRILHSIGPARP